ncbi:hypothetical protein HGA91_05280 [candidate division WWE3 bacterium]|nr:hypothetical protein [candidate division WWE3 bacterium]
MRFDAKFTKQLISFVIVLIEFFLGVRVLLKLVAANQSAPFVQWMYDITSPLSGPFSGMFPSSVSSGMSEIEFSTLFGMLMYAFFAYILIYLVNMLERSKPYMPNR